MSTSRCHTWLNSDNHSRTQFDGTLYVVGVVNIHAKIMAYVMWTELARHLQFSIINKCTIAAKSTI